MMYDVGHFRNMMFSMISEFETEPQLIGMAEELREKIFSSLSEKDYQYVLDDALATLSVSFGESYFVESDEKLIPWFESYYKDLGVTRWDRYAAYLKNKKGFAPSVINAMKENLFKITDLLGDPNGTNFERKGLVVGDVQSGKTANYIGLMNLATDAHYKLIIILTGTTNTLREQTQIRIEDGLGKESQNPKGVSALNDIDYQEFLSPVYLTSKERDFTKSAGQSTALSLEQTKVPIVIVTKKNSSALKNIYEWLVEYSQIKNHDYINSSLLLIDDEADFASVNTRKEDESPTAINSRIRNILNLFTRSSYVGFTATPFANIFIDPESIDEMGRQDLFPRDYIYVLGESSDYLGVQRIFSEKADKANMLIKIAESEVTNYLELKHKKETPFNNLSPSMIHAINLFFIANVIRDLRGSKASHRSMLLNLSVYTSMHQKVKDVVMEYVHKLQKEIRLYGKLPIQEALEREEIRSLKKSFEKEYSSLEEGYTFTNILKNMNDSVYRIKVAIVNKDNKEVDYLLNEKEGERVIVIGGFALARGLTLEGLIISFYWRNSVMYDSLLQMGRWFGYRPGYEDLVRIFMTDDVISDFKFIALATEELKDDLEVNANRGLTPRDFGIKVRSGQTGLIITARNKMRTGSKIITSANFNKEIIEMLAISVEDKELNMKNISFIKEFVTQHKELLSDELNPDKPGEVMGLVGVDKAHVIQFLKRFIPINASRFDSELITKWLNANDSKVLNNWDFVFINGRDGKEIFDYGFGITGQSNKRTMVKVDGHIGIYKNKNSRLGSPSDGKFGLTRKQVNSVRKKYKENVKSIVQKSYFDANIKRNPIIAIYSVVPYDSDEENKPLTDYPIPFISVGIPDLGTGKSKFVNYTVNKIYQTANEIEVEEYD